MSSPLEIFAATLESKKELHASAFVERSHEDLKDDENFGATIGAVIVSSGRGRPGNNGLTSDGP